MLRCGGRQRDDSRRYGDRELGSGRRGEAAHWVHSEVRVLVAYVTDEREASRHQHLDTHQFTTFILPHTPSSSQQVMSPTHPDDDDATQAPGTTFVPVLGRVGAQVDDETAGDQVAALTSESGRGASLQAVTGWIY